MQHRNWLIVLLGITLIMFTASCSLMGSQPAPEPTPTRTPWPTFTPTPQGQIANAHLFTVEPSQPITNTGDVAVLPTDTPSPIPTETPTAAPTPEPPTPTPQPASAIARQTVNVRSGPGTNYNIVGRTTAGQRFPIIGKNPAGDWWQIDFNGSPNWIIGRLVDVEGPVDAIVVAANIPAAPVAPPPTARPQPRPQPTTPPAVAPPPTSPPPAQPATPQYPFSLLKGVETCSPNVGTTYFDGFVRDRSNNPVNGVCVHVAFYGPRNTKCSGCDGVGDGRWGFSPFGGPAPKGTPVEIFVVPCPASLPGGGQSESSGFGDLTPQSDKWTRTINESEQCTGITFVKN